MGFSCRHCGEEEKILVCNVCEETIHVFCDGSSKVITHLQDDDTPMDSIPDSRCRLKNKTKEKKKKRRGGRKRRTPQEEN